jgi:hypothetical protein
MTADGIIAKIQNAFAPVECPDAPFLVSSREGCEPAEVAEAFAGKDWRSLDAAFLDENYTALSFFSEGAFRYFVPAYLIADVRGELRTADPMFHLVHGFVEVTTRVPAGDEMFDRSYGGSTLLNPRRYGAITWRDYAGMRLAAFTREEAEAIVAYLEFRRERTPDAGDRPQIDAALETFWRHRAAHAATQADLARHRGEEQRFFEAIKRAKND